MTCSQTIAEMDTFMKQWKKKEWLGHSDFSTTANIYAHLDYSSKLSSASAMINGMVLPETVNFGSRWKTIKSVE